MRLAHFLLACVVAWPAWAGDRALIVGNERYERARNIVAASAVRGAIPAFEAAGFRVIAGADLDGDALRARLSDLLENLDEAERIVVVLSGHFAQSSGGGGWFLGTDADAPDLATVGEAGVALGVVLEIAAAAPGGAVVLLGTGDRGIALGDGLSPGIGLPAVPQGVAVITGPAAAIAAFARRDLVQPGRSLPDLLAAHPDLSATGFLSPLVSLVPAPFDGTPTADPFAADRALWEAAEAIDTEESYRRYLDRYPAGRHAGEARAAIEAIRDEPERAARLTEEALSLGRDQRRAVQRNLNLLGFDTRGIDGIFGPGTRNAITSWQRRNGAEPTGYLTRDALVRLTAQAERRAAELEEEEAARRAQQEREDNAYWQETGAAGNAVGLRTYLRRFPEGLFAERARAQLDTLERDRRGESAARDRAEQDRAEQDRAAQDRAAWQRAERDDDADAYRRYLQDWPDGAFTGEARARLDRITGDRAAIEAARRQEEALNLPALTRQLIEGRLQTMGLDPGVVDGNFDADTRRAIRRYQAERNLPMTGYLNRALLVQLLADSLPLQRN